MKIIVLVAITLQAMLWPLNCEAQQAYISRNAPYPSSGVAIGNGWSTESEQKTAGNCIIAKEAQVPSQIVSLHLGQAQDIGDIARELSVSATMQLKVGLIGGADANATYALSKKFRQDQFTIMVHELVQYGARYITASDDFARGQGRDLLQRRITAHNANEASRIDNQIVALGLPSIRLRPEAAQLLVDKKFDEFRKTCGDSFVATIWDAAEIYSTITNSVVTDEELEKYKKSLGLNVLGQSFSGNLEETLKILTTSKNSSLDFRATGGLGGNAPTNVDELLQKLKEFPEFAKNKGVPLQIELVRYTSLPNWPLNVDLPIAASPATLTFERLLRLRTLLDEALYIDANRDSYIFNWGISATNGSDFYKAIDELRATIQLLQQRAAGCFNDASRKLCKFSDIDQRDIYEFAINLPIPKNYSAADRELRSQYGSAVSAIKDFNDKKNGAFYAFGLGLLPPLPPSVCAAVYDCNRFVTQWAERYWLSNTYPAVARLISAASNYPSRLREDSAEFRLRRHWRNYCGISASHILCLKSTEIDKISQNILIKGHSASVNGDGTSGPPTFGGEATKTDKTAILSFSLDSN